jgi:peptidase M48-like protein/uncharacterized protein DUF5666
MRRATWLCVLLTVCVVPAAAKAIKIHGYVTNITSPTNFKIEDYRITHDQSLVLDLEKADNDENLTFHPEDIRVGTEMEIKGDYNRETGELRATAIKVFLNDSKKLKRTAMSERPPDLQRKPTGWEGTVFADGQRIHVDSSTQLRFKPNKGESREMKEHSKETKHRDKAEQSAPPAESDADENRPVLESLDQIGPDTFITYQGRRRPDGSVEATQAQFTRSEIEKGEAKLWHRMEPTLKGGSIDEGKQGELRIEHVGKYKLFRNEEVQKYVERIGESLVPEFQRNMAAEDPSRIHFRFYVVNVKDPNAFALANGVVIVHSSLLTVLDNEAQPAAVLGHEITHTIEKHTWHELQYHKKERTALKIGGAVAAGFGAYGIEDAIKLTEAAIQNGYARSLENQADREGMQNMMAAGYDPREAANVWKAMARTMGGKPTNFFWSDHDNFTTRRSYLMAELRNNYAGIDFSSMKKDTDEFQKMAAAARAGTTSKKKIKVKY